MSRYLLILLIFLAGVTIAGGIYKWVDEQGRTVYSDTPPPGKAAQPVGIPPQPPKEVLERAHQQRLEKQRQERQRHTEREEATKSQKSQEAAAEREALARKQRCILARQNLHTLQMQKAVYSINEKGERVFLDDKMRAAEIERMKKEVESYCEPQ